MADELAKGKGYKATITPEGSDEVTQPFTATIAYFHPDISPPEPQPEPPPVIIIPPVPTPIPEPPPPPEVAPSTKLVLVLANNEWTWLKILPPYEPPFNPMPEPKGESEGSGRRGR